MRWRATSSSTRRSSWRPPYRLSACSCSSAVSPPKTAYIGGVFKSEMLRERFRLLVELEDGNDVIAPQYGPGVGALIEAYAGSGIAAEISGSAEAEK